MQEIWQLQEQVFENIPINLVTAVPSIETYANIKNKKYSYSRIN